MNIKNENNIKAKKTIGETISKIIESFKNASCIARLTFWTMLLAIVVLFLQFGLSNLQTEIDKKIQIEHEQKVKELTEKAEEIKSKHLSIICRGIKIDNPKLLITDELIVVEGKFGDTFPLDKCAIIRKIVK